MKILERNELRHLRGIGWEENNNMQDAGRPQLHGRPVFDANQPPVARVGYGGGTWVFLRAFDWTQIGLVTFIYVAQEGIKSIKDKERGGGGGGEQSHFPVSILRLAAVINI